VIKEGSAIKLICNSLFKNAAVLAKFVSKSKLFIVNFNNSLICLEKIISLTKRISYKDLKYLSAKPLFPLSVEEENP